MFDLQSSSPTCDRLAIVSELLPLDQERRDPLRSDFLVITMKRRKKGIVATDVQLNILLYQPITRRGGQNSRHMQAMHQGENGEPEVSGSDSSNYRGHSASTRLVTQDIRILQGPEEKSNNAFTRPLIDQLGSPNPCIITDHVLIRWIFGRVAWT